jgi:hypothetical protein
VIVEDRLRGGIFPVETAGRLVAQEKIFMDESGRHGDEGNGGLFRTKV